jgi:DNA-binding SARP family transcriptional activator/predicted ATPase
MSLKIYLLGEFNLQANDRTLELPSRPAQSLLAYLALNAGVTHRREKLAGLLWPEASETNARSYLRRTLWRIHKTLSEGSIHWEDFLNISDISVKFDDASDYWLDADELMGPIDTRSVDEIVEIVSLYRGELLPGFYDEWVVLERDRLQAAYHQKISLLLDRLIQAGRWEDALEWGEQWIRHSYSPERAYRALMSAYAGLGDQSLIHVTYQRCVESLKRELGVDPSSETQQLFERLCRGQVDRPSFMTSPVPQNAARQPAFLNERDAIKVEDPIFVAREPELARLETFLNPALDGAGGVIFVTGETGSGKTALLNEFTRRAQEVHPDLIVADGTCNAHTGIGDPYLPFREILELLTGDVEDRWAAGSITQEHAHRLWNLIPLTAQALVETGPDLIETFISRAELIERSAFWTPDHPEWLTHLSDFAIRKPTDLVIFSLQQKDLFDQFTRVLQALARKVPLVIVIDDLQWADLGSINLLFHLSRNLTRSRILIVGAYRSEDVALGRDGARHPLEPLVNEVQRNLGNILVNLDQAESRNFVEDMLDSEPNCLGHSFREMLFRQTRGQPLFTIELLRGMQERGDLVQNRKGQWIEGDSLDWDTRPARVEAVIAERIGRLSKPLQAALRVASVEGNVFTAEVIARVEGTDKHELLGSLSRELDKRHHLIRAHRIQRIDGQLLSRYQFRHTLFQKYIYSSLDDVERVHLHELIGNSLEELYSAQEEGAESGEIAPQLARHFQEAKIPLKAIHYLHQAGKRSVHLSAYKEAIDLLNKALALLMTLPDSPERDQQELALQISIGMALIGDIPDPKWGNAIVRARELCDQTGKTTELCRVLAELCIYHYVRAEYEKAREFAEEALRLAEMAGDPLLISWCQWSLGFVNFSLGEFTSAHTHLKEAYSNYEPQKHHSAFISLRGSDVGVSAMAYDACCLWCLGYPDQALNRSQEVLALSRDLNHAFSLADVLCFGGCVFNQLRRDPAALMDFAPELMELSKGMGFSSFGGTGTCYWGMALIQQGQIQKGIAEMRKGIAARQAVGARCYLTGILGALAEAQAMAGRLEDGMTTLEEALAMVEETDERYYEAILYRLRGELLIQQCNEGEAEASLLKAIEIARRQQAKSYEMQIALDLARLWKRQGRLSEAQELLRETYNWFTEGFETPDLKAASAMLEN